MNWRVQVLGRLALTQGSHEITHFESVKVAVLLAYLALSPQRSHPREELLDLLWPDIDPIQARPRLRQALYSLRHQLEPPGTPSGSVLIADRHSVRLNPATFTCDAAEFERLVKQGRFAEATNLYVGEFLPGYYDDWILQERYRLAFLRENLPLGLPQDAINSQSVPDESGVKPVASPLLSRPNLLLPHYLTDFFGREDEQRQLITQLSQVRLLTLTGLGGIGKTRLAVTIGRASAAQYDVVAFAPLADQVAPSQIPEAIRLALGLPASSASTLEQLTIALAPSRVLLILDNFEQLVAAGGAGVVENLLARLPHLTCLVTSRRVLGVAGEQEFHLSPLPLPSPTDTLTEIARNPGVALFMRRAQAARPGFQLTERNRDTVLALCRSLEGVPLALELAASRIRSLTPSEMQAQIQARFDWLAQSGPGADKEPRQRSLRAALEWSWRLLSPAQQKFLAACTVFQGGWTAEAAVQVCQAADARERLETLITDSLVLSAPTTQGTMRFQMLETVRAYAREQLAPEELSTLQSRHLAAFLDVALQSGQYGGRSAALQSEGDNLLGALRTALAQQDVQSALALSVAVDEGWMALTGAQDSLALICQALQLPGSEAQLRLRALNLAAYLAITAGKMEQALSLASEGLRLAEDQNGARAIALTTRAKVALTRGEPLEPIGHWLEDAYRLAEIAEDTRVQASALRLQGIRAARMRQFATAEDHFAHALQISQAAGDRQGVIYALARQAVAAQQQNHLDRALELNRLCQQRAHEAGDMVYEAEMYQNLACIYAAQGCWHDSLEAGRECLRRNQLLGNTYILTLTLYNLAEPLVQLHQESLAVRLLSAAARFWTDHYSPLDENDMHFCRDIRAHAAQTLGESQTAELWQTGANLSLFQALELALTE